MAHLATLTSAEELAFVLQEVLANLAQPTPDDAPLDAYWLGATAEENRGDRTDTWRWTTGEPWQYSAWAPGEPNNGNETALSLWGAFSDRTFGTWNNLLPGAIPDNDLHKVWSLVEWERATPSDTCSVAVTNYKQTDPRWSAVRMDSRILPGDTLGTIGCTVTALSIVFSHAGLSVDPPTMNRWLVERRGFTPKGVVEYTLSSREGSAGLLRFVDLER